MWTLSDSPSSRSLSTLHISPLRKEEGSPQHLNEKWHLPLASKGELHISRQSPRAKRRALISHRAGDPLSSGAGDFQKLACLGSRGPPAAEAEPEWGCCCLAGLQKLDTGVRLLCGLAQGPCVWGVGAAVSDGLADGSVKDGCHSHATRSDVAW